MSAQTSAQSVGSSEGLGVGTRLLLQWGSGGCKAVIIAEGNGRVAVEMDGGGVDIMDSTELERRKYIVLPAKPKTWLQRLLTPNGAHTASSSAAAPGERSNDVR